MSFAVPPAAPRTAASGPAPHPATGGTANKKTVEIVTIPEKFYGVALKMKVVPFVIQQEAPPPKPAPPKPTPAAAPVASRQTVMLVAGVVAFFLALIGGFIYFNRDLLFKKSVPIQPPAPKVLPPPAPYGLSATTTGTGGVVLNWTDSGSRQTGYRVEREEAANDFVPLTNLPPNSTAFLDVSAQPGKRYGYRVVAMNEAGDSPSSNAVFIALAALPQPPMPSPPPPPDGLDSDSDGLTDVEETLWGTDPHKADTGGEGFLDGNAVFNLYSPTHKSPATLLDAQQVTVVTSTLGWSIWVPVAWTVAQDGPNGSHATFVTGRGETFTISVDDNFAHQTLNDWALSHVSGTASGVTPVIHTKGGSTIQTPMEQRGRALDGAYSPDRLSAFFAWGDKILTLRYQLNGQSFIYFRTTFGMMLNSLRLTPVPVAPPPAAKVFVPPTVPAMSVSSTVSASST